MLVFGTLFVVAWLASAQPAIGICVGATACAGAQNGDAPATTDIYDVVCFGIQ